MSLFSRACIHPFAALYIEKPQTIKAADRYYEHVTYHLHCSKCGKELKVVAAQSIGGLEASMARQLADLAAARKTERK